MASKLEDELAPYEVKKLEGLQSGESRGAGSYGSVYRVKVNGYPCIAKRLHDILVGRIREVPVSDEEKAAIQARFRVECVILSKLRHPNIVQFIGVHYGRTRDDLTLVMECLYTDLDKCLQKCVKEGRTLPLPLQLSILLDVSYGLLYLHTRSKPVIHRDLKAENVLLAWDMRAKLADLGASKILNLHPTKQTAQTKCPGSQGVMPPEALVERPKYDEKLDDFSFGTLVLNVANQEFAYPYEVQLEQCTKGEVHIAKRRTAIEKMGKGHCLYDLVIRCLQDDPKKRPTTAEICKTIERLVKKCPQQFKDVLEMYKEIERVQESARQFQERLQQQEEEQQKIHGILTQTEKERESLMKAVQEQDGKLQELQHQMKDKEKELEMAKEQMKKEHTLEMERTVQTLLTNQKLEKDSQIREQEAKLHELQAQQEQKLKDAQMLFDTKERSIRSIFAKQKNEMESQIQEKIASIQDFEKRLEQAQDEKRRLEGVIAAAEEERDAQSQARVVKEIQIQQLQKQLQQMEQLKAKQQSLHGELQELRQQLKDKEEEAEREKEKQHKYFQSLLQRQAKQVEAALAQQEQAQKQVAELEEQTKVRIHEAEQQHQLAVDQKGELEAALCESQEAYAQLQKAQRASERQLLRTQQEFKQRLHEKEAEFQSNFEKEKQRLTQEFLTTVEQKGQELSASESKLGKLQDKIQKYDETLKQQHKYCQQLLDLKEERAVEAQAQLEEASKYKAEASKAQEEKQLMQREKEKQKLETAIRDLQSELDREREEHKKTRDERVQWQSQHEKELEQAKKELEAEFLQQQMSTEEKFEATTSNLQSELDQEREQHNKTRDERADWQSQHEKTKKELEQAQNEYQAQFAKKERSIRSLFAKQKHEMESQIQEKTASIQDFEKRLEQLQDEKQRPEDRMGTTEEERDKAIEDKHALQLQLQIQVKQAAMPARKAEEDKPEGELQKLRQQLKDKEEEAKREKEKQHRYIQILLQRQVEKQVEAALAQQEQAQKQVAELEEQTKVRIHEAEQQHQLAVDQRRELEAQLQETKREYEQQVQEKEREIHESTGNFEREKQQLKQKLQATVEQKEAAEAMLEELQGKGPDSVGAQLEQQYKYFQQLLNRQQKQAEVAQVQLAEAKKEKTELEEQIQQLREQMAKQHEMPQNQKAAPDVALEEMKQGQGETQALLDEAQKKHEQQLQDKEKEYQAKVNEIESEKQHLLEQQMKDKEGEYQAAIQKTKQQNKEALAQKQELEVALEEIKQGQLDMQAQHEQQLQDKKKEYLAKVEEIEIEKEQLKQLLEQQRKADDLEAVSKTEQETQQLQMEVILSEKERELADAAARIKELEKKYQESVEKDVRIAELEKDLSKIHSTHFPQDAISPQLPPSGQMEATLRGNERELADAATRIEQLEKKYQESVEKDVRITELEEDLSRIQSTHFPQDRDQLELETMRQKCDAWRGEVEKLAPLREEADQLHSQVVELEGQIDQVTQENEGLGKQLQDVLDESVRKQSEMARKVADYDRLREWVTELRQIRANLENELAPLREERAAILTENAQLREGSQPENYTKLREEYASLAHQFEQLQTALQEQAALVQRHEKTNTQLRQQVNEATNPEQLQSVRDRLERYRGERDQARLQNDELQTRLNQIEMESQQNAADSQQLLSQFQQEATSWEHNNSTLAAKVEEYEGRMRRYREERNQAITSSKAFEQQISTLQGTINELLQQTKPTVPNFSSLQSGNLESMEQTLYQHHTSRESSLSPTPRSETTDTLPERPPYSPQSYIGPLSLTEGSASVVATPEDSRSSHRLDQQGRKPRPTSKGKRKGPSFDRSGSSFNESGPFLANVKAREGVVQIYIQRPLTMLNVKHKPQVVVKRSDGEYERGTLMFTGKVQGTKDLMAGVQLEIPRASGTGTGVNDGTYRDGKMYFKCLPGYGYYTPLSQVYVEAK